MINFMCKSTSPKIKPFPFLYHLIFFSMLLLCLSSIVSRLFMTEHLPFIMDEFVDTQIACQLERGDHLYKNYQWPRTPLMNYMIAETVGAGINSFYTAVTARKLMWLFTVFIFILTFLISRQLNNNYTALFAITLLASYTTFLDHSIRVRADLVSTLLSLPALWILVTPSLPIFFIGLAGFLLGLSFLATQKAVYFVIAFGISLIFREIGMLGLNKNFIVQLAKKVSISAVGFFIPIILFIVWLFITDQLSLFIKNGLIDAAHAGLANNTYKEATKIFLKLTIIRNPAFWLLGISGIFIYFLQGLKKTGKEDFDSKLISVKASYIAISSWTITLLVLIIRHKVKFPYVFLNISPSLAISAAFPLYMGINYLFENKNKAFHYLNLLIISLCLYFLLIPPLYRHHSNLTQNSLISIQKAVMDRVDTLTNLNDAVFDGTGMAVTRKKATPYSLTARWFNERKSGANYDIISSLKDSEPKVMILNYRIRKLENDETNFLKSHFVWDWANVFVVGKKILHNGTGETKNIINILSSTKYAIISSYRENIRIDGEIPESTIFLAAGDHEIIITGPSQEVVLKYLKAVEKPLSPKKPFVVLFPSYSD